MGRTAPTQSTHSRRHARLADHRAAARAASRLARAPGRSGAAAADARARRRTKPLEVGDRQGARAESLAREHALLARLVLDLALSDQNALSRVPGGPLINVSDR